MVLLKNSGDLPKAPVILIHGPPKVGKTWLAATVSERFDAGGPLSDVLWLPWDNGAVDGLTEAGITMPCLDIGQALAEKTNAKGSVNFVAATQTILAEAASEVAKGQIRWVVTDTLSMLDKGLNEHFERNCPETKEGNPDSLAMYRLIFNAHKRYHMALRAMNVGLIYLCHSKVLGDNTKPAEAMKRKATQAVDFAIGPDITGAANTVYKGEASLYLVVTAKQDPKSKKLTRSIAPFGGKGFEGGSRFTQNLSEEEPANLHALLTKCYNRKA